ncbi:hypothetical protein ACFQH8_05895 [Halomicroarcula sp. GCM10025710]
MTDPLCFRSVPELALEMRRDTVSAVDVVEAHLERIEDRDERTNAFVEVFERDALAAAREADRARREGEGSGRSMAYR